METICRPTTIVIFIVLLQVVLSRHHGTIRPTKHFKEVMEKESKTNSLEEEPQTEDVRMNEMVIDLVRNVKPYETAQKVADKHPEFQITYQQKTHSLRLRVENSVLNCEHLATHVFMQLINEDFSKNVGINCAKGLAIDL